MQRGEQSEIPAAVIFETVAWKSCFVQDHSLFEDEYRKITRVNISASSFLLVMMLSVSASISTLQLFLVDIRLFEIRVLLRVLIAPRASRSF